MVKEKARCKSLASFIDFKMSINDLFRGAFRVISCRIFGILISKAETFVSQTENKKALILQAFLRIPVLSRLC